MTLMVILVRIHVGKGKIKKGTTYYRYLVRFARKHYDLEIRYSARPQPTV